jgi:hypothetical protein
MKTLSLHDVLRWQRVLLSAATELSGDMANAAGLQEKYQATELAAAHRRLCRLRGELRKVPNYEDMQK